MLNIVSFLLEVATSLLAANMFCEFFFSSFSPGLQETPAGSNNCNNL